MRNRSRLRRVIALATIVGALAAPAAWAATFEERVPSAAGNGLQGESYSPSAASQPSTTVSESTTVSGDGFSWGDAGIGAATMLALAAIAVGAVVVTGHRSGRQTVA